MTQENVFQLENDTSPKVFLAQLEKKALRKIPVLWEVLRCSSLYLSDFSDANVFTL